MATPPTIAKLDAAIQARQRRRQIRRLLGMAFTPIGEWLMIWSRLTFSETITISLRRATLRFGRITTQTRRPCSALQIITKSAMPTSMAGLTSDGIAKKSSMRAARAAPTRRHEFLSASRSMIELAWPRRILLLLRDMQKWRICREDLEIAVFDT